MPRALMNSVPWSSCRFQTATRTFATRPCGRHSYSRRRRVRRVEVPHESSDQLAPFLFDEVRSRWPSVSRGMGWIRLSNRLFFGARREERLNHPSTAGAFACRLRTAASIVIKVVAASLAAVNMANGVPLLLGHGGVGQTPVPRFVFRD